MAHPRLTVDPLWAVVLAFVDRTRWAWFLGVAVLYAAGAGGVWRVTPDSAIHVGLARSVVEGRGVVDATGREAGVMPGLAYTVAAAWAVMGVVDGGEGGEGSGGGGGVVEEGGAPASGAAKGVDSGGGWRGPGWGGQGLMLGFAAAVLVMTWRVVRLYIDRPTADVVVVLLAVNRLFYEHAVGMLTELPFTVGVMLMLWGHERRGLRQGVNRSLGVPHLGRSGPMGDGLQGTPRTHRRKAGEVWHPSVHALFAWLMIAAGIAVMLAYRTVGVVFAGGYVLAEMVRLWRSGRRGAATGVLGAVTGVVGLAGVLLPGVRADVALFWRTLRGVAGPGVEVGPWGVWGWMAGNAGELLGESVFDAVFGQDLHWTVAGVVSAGVLWAGLRLGWAKIREGGDRGKGRGATPCRLWGKVCGAERRHTLAQSGQGVAPEGGRRLGRPLWAVLIGVCVAQWVVFDAAGRYLLPLLPVLLVGVWRATVEMYGARHVWWRDWLCCLVLAGLTVPNLVGVGRVVVERHRAEFYDHYADGKYVPVMRLAGWLRANTPAGAVVMANPDMPSELAYFADRGVVHDPNRYAVAAPAVVVVTPTDARREAGLARLGWAVGGPVFEMQGLKGRTWRVLPVRRGTARP